MDTFQGTVINDSYYLKLNSGSYKINFSVIIDRSKYIFSELSINLTSNSLKTFKIGDRVLITGKLVLSYGFFIEADSVSKLSLFI